MHIQKKQYRLLQLQVSPRMVRKGLRYIEQLYILLVPFVSYMLVNTSDKCTNSHKQDENAGTIKYYLVIKKLTQDSIAINFPM